MKATIQNKLSIPRTQGESICANNTDMGLTMIEHLWYQFQQGELPISKNLPLLAVYSNYTDGVNGDYTFTLANVVQSSDIEIPEGNYYIVEVNVNKPEDMKMAIVEAWRQIWNNTEIKRAFVCDYELYTSPTKAIVAVQIL